MSPDEHERDDLRSRLAQALGDDTAGRLMEHLPPRWDKLALNEDVLALREDMLASRQDMFALREDLEEVRADVSVLKTDVSVLKTDVAVLKTDVSALKTDVAELRTEVRGFRTEVGLEMQALRHELVAVFRGELNSAVTSQTRTMIFTMAGSLVSLAALSMTLGRFG